MLLRQGADQLREIPGEQVDGTLLELAKLLLAARSPIADPHATLILGPMTEISTGEAAADAGPAHNED